jgi:hypothetical protein
MGSLAAVALLLIPQKEIFLLSAHTVDTESLTRA